MANKYLYLNIARKVYYHPPSQITRCIQYIKLCNRIKKKVEVNIKRYWCHYQVFNNYDIYVLIMVSNLPVFLRFVDRILELFQQYGSFLFMLLAQK